MVKYKLVPHDKRYRVGTDGSVWTRCGWRNRCGKVWRKLKPTVLKRYPYHVVKVASKVQMVHPLILITFKGPRPPGMEVAHKNGIHGDNRLSNLTWKTHKQNHEDRVVHGTSRRGSKATGSKLSESDIPIIRRRLANGEMHKDIAKTYGVTPSTITLIANGKNWSWLK